MEKQRLLVDMDVLLDTRLSAISQVSEDAATFLINNGYQERLSDNFETITNGLIKNEDYQKAYLERSKDTLKKSVITMFPFALKGIVKNLTNLAVNTPLVKEVAVGINLWPYYFSNDEKQMLKLVLQNYLGYDFDYSFEFVRLAPHELTPSYLKTHWEGYATYDYDLWLRDNYQALMDNPIPKYTLMGPAVSKVDALSKPFIELEEMGEVDPYQFIELFLAPFIALELLDINLFSIYKLPV